MLSKNNHQLQAQKLEAKQQHFAIKKLTIGVASVLISSTFAMYAGSHTAMAAETAPQSDTASEKTDSNKQNMKKEVVLNSAKPETTNETPAKAPAKPTAEVSSAESATASTDKATQTEHSQVESQPQAKPATAASSSAVVSKPQENTNVQPQSKPTVTTTPVVSAPTTTENTVARPAQTAPAQTAPTQATPAVQAQKSPQWQADATKAVDNKTGLYTPQLSYNAKWYSMSVDPGRLTPDVMKGNSIPFTAVNHRSNITAILSADYKFRIQLDDRLVDKVADISISPADTVNEVVHFKRVYNDAQKPTNIWEANVVYKRGGIFGGLFASAGKATMARNGKIMLNDTLDNIYPKLPNVAKSPLVYNAYVYDNSSRTALLSTNNEGYIVGPNDPLAKVPVTSDFGGKFMGANSTVSYDPTVGKNGALIVYYQAEKSNMWFYDSDWKFKLHYAIDPALLPYIEKNNGAYTVELDKAADGWGADGSYGFEQVTDPKTGKSLWKPTAYLSKLEYKVADLPLNLDGTGVFDPTNMADYVQFNSAVAIAGRPVMVRLVYHLNKKPEDIYTDMLKKGTAGGNLLFSQYYGDSNDTMQNYSLATSMLTFNDSDGDTLPDLKEESVFTNPHVSMPNVSNAYGTENKVHGQLVFSNVEKNTQHVTVEDKTGKVLGETDVQPVRFNGLAKALPFEVELKGNALAANSNLVVRVLSKLDGNGESTENEEPQETALKVKVGPVAASGFTYPLNAVFLQDPKELITNVKELPANATYTFVKKPDLSTSGMKNAVVKVSFPDQYDPSYLHEMEVNVPVKVEDVDLKAGKFTLKPLVMHVNEVNDDMRPLPVEELQSWQETDGKKTLSGDPLWSLVKSVTWSQSPSTKHAGTAQGVVTVTTKDDKTTLANVPVNIIGATAKQGVKTPWGTSVTAKDMIANTTELAQFGKVTPLTYTWKTPLNVTPAESEDHVVHNTVVVDYGDKTTQEVPVTVTVGPSLASKFKAPLDKVTVHYGQVLDPATVLTSEQKAQAKVSKVAFAAPVTTTTLGDQQVATTLTFEDGSTASVSLPVQVQGATARTGVKTAWNVLPAAQTLVDNVSALAKYTPTYAWQQQPNVTPGKNQTHVVSGVVNVTYPDKVVQAVPVTLEVGSSQATVFDEATTEKLVPVVVNHGATVATTDALQALTPENRKQFSVTQATFTTPVETTTDGTKNVPATLTFADTSTTTVAVPVKVVGATVKSPVETEWGKVPDAASVVADPTELQPFGATYSWGLAPATTLSAKEDHKVMGQLLVTYRDGAKQMLPVTVTVKKSAGEEFVAAKDHLVLQPVTVNYGATVTADTANKALTPTEKANLKVANVNFKNAVDTLTVGDSLQPVQVSFTDGSTLEMSVPVKVVGAVAKQGLSTPWGTKVAAKQLVANADDLAQFGSKDHPVMYQWLSEPVVTPAKEQSHTVSGVVTVTYGDGAKQQLPVSFAVEPSAAEKLMENTRQVYVPLTVNYGAKVDPSQALSEVSAETQQQLKLATAKFTVPVQTTELGTKDYPATLSFTDGSNMTAQLPVKVVGAQVKPVVKTTWGVLPDASTVVSDPTELTKFGPTYTWKVSPVTTPTPEQSHQTTGTLQVTFADGAKQEVPVSLTVAPSMAEVAAKVLQTQLVEEDLNTNVPATDATKGLTAETKQKYSVTAASFDQVVDTSKVGEKDYTATVSFADGSTTKLPLTVKVVSQAEKYAPVAKQDLTAKVSEVLEPAKLLDPSVTLPTGTKVSWKTPVDTTKAGHQTGEVEVTYPDGSNDFVPVAVKVGTDAQAVTPKAKSDLKVALGSKLTPEAALDPSVTLPTGTKVNWKTPVDTTKAGHQIGEVEVTYPDGSKDEVSVPVKVGTDAQATTPKAKADLKVALGGKLSSDEVLDPSVTMPTGTKVSWKTPVDTTKAGHQTGELEVTYPDGSKDEVSVPVKVGTDAQALAPKAKANLEVALDSKLAPEAALDPSVVLPTGAKVNWKTSVDTTKAGHQTGEVEVTYPDGSKDEVSVPVKVGTDAQAVTPKAKANLEVELGSKLMPEAALDPSVTMPAGTKVSWKTPVNTTKAGHQTGELEVTYPDGSKDEVSVPVKVGTDAQATTPKAKSDLKVALGGKLLPEGVLDPSVTMPTGTKLNWKTPVDTNKAGHQTGKLEVTYPDGSKDEVSVPVKVGTDAQAVTPKAKSNLEVALGSKLTPEEVLDPSVALPTGTKLNWKDPVDTTKAGHQTGKLEVTYPDGSKDEVSVPVKVGTDAQALAPKAKVNLEVALGSKLTPEEVLDPSVALPTGTKLNWKDPVDTNKAGHQTGKLEVTYPDGSKDEVSVPVKVGTDAQAEMPKAKADLKVALGSKLALEAALNPSVVLPTGTKLNWKTPVDTTKAGHQTGELEVTYPDGSKDEVSVPVKVGTDAQALAPKAKANLDVALDSKLAPEEVLDPSVSLPTGTKLNWKTPVDTTKAGHQTGELEVTYPDGSKDEVSVPVKVGTDAQAVTPKAKANLAVALDSKLAPEATLDSNVTLPAGTKVSWKTPVDTTKAGHQTGKLEVTYPDGSKDEVSVPVKVGTDAQAVTPKAKANLEVALGSKLMPEAALDPSVVLPTGAKVNWKTPVDTTKAGHQTGELEVTYPDDSKDEVSVPVKVGTDAQAVMPKVKTNLKVDLGSKLAPEATLDSNVTLPAGTKVSWKTPVDTTKAGHQTGKLEVAYPDGSKDEVSVPVKVGTDAQAVTPKAKANLAVALGSKLTPEAALDPSVSLPTGTKLNWKDPVGATRAGHQTGKLEVTYPDGSKDEVSVPVKVGTDAQALAPKAKANLEVALNSKLAPETALDPSVVLPTGAKVNWKTPVDTTKAGHQTGELEVTYPDSSKDEVSVPVKVGTDAQATTPKAKADLKVALGGKVLPEEVLDPSVTMPAGTKVSWKTPVNTNKAGHQTGELEVTYPDGSQDVVKVPVKVGTDAQAVVPKVKTDLKVDLGSKLMAEAVLDPGVTLPAGTKVSWKMPVNTTKAGHQTGELEVTYPDGSQDVVKVPVKVGMDAQAVMPKVKTDLKVDLGSKLMPEAVLDPSVTLPAETKVSWKTPVNTTKAGHQTGELEVTYPDGSQDLVKVPVKVGTDAQATMPKVKSGLKVTLGDKLLPKEVLDPSVMLPTGTKVSWKTPVNTTKAGHQTGELEVTYPDGSQDLVKVSVKVGTDAQATAPKAKQNLEVSLGSKLTPEEVLDPSVALPAGTKLNWKTSVDTTKAGHQTGELEVTYPDGSKDLVKVPVKVGTDGQAVTPKAKTNLEVSLGSKVTPEEVLDPSVTLPTGTKVSWKTSVDTTKAGHQTGEVEVTYPDGSKDVVKVPVKVGTDDEALTPVAKNDLEVKLGSKLTPEEVLDPSVALPAGTKLNWKTPVDTTKAGHQTGELEVTYPDGSKDLAKVSVKVGTDAQALTPKAKVNLEVSLDSKLTPEEVLDPSVALPAGTKLNWKVSVDTTKAGHQTGELEVTYPDGSKDLVKVSVKVGTDGQAVTPKAKANLEVSLGSKLTPEEVLDPSVTLPTGTKVSWKRPVDTTKAGHQTGKLEVTYPDGSKDLVKVSVKVGTDAQAVTPKAKANLEVSLGSKLTPEEVLDPSVTLPTGTKVSWKAPVDTTKSGHQTGELEVTYPDGSKDLVKVQVKVGTDAQALTPKAKVNLEVSLGSKLTPEEVLDPSVALPAGTKLNWKTPVDTTKAGHQTGELEVTYPDGSQDLVKVSVKVGTDAQATTPKAKTNLEVSLGSKLTPEEVLDPSVALPAGTKLNWKTPVDTTKAGHQTGELEVTYPDGSQDLVKVSVKVGTDADLNDLLAKVGVVVKLHEKVAPQQLLVATDKLPKGTQFVWAKAVDADVTGDQTGEVKVVYPDKSSDVVDVTVKVQSVADQFTPTAVKDLVVTKGTKLVLTNLVIGTLPAGSQLNWTVPVDTEKLGMQLGKLEVVYADGSKDQVSVPVKVVDVTKSAKVTHEADHPQAKAVKKVVSTHQVGHKQHVVATVENTKQVLPQTGENTSKNTSLVGLVLLMLLGLFNFGVGYDKKKH